MISILTTGTRGDIQPYLALGLALKQAGQDVRIAAFENYAAWIKSYDLSFYPIKGDVTRVAAKLGEQGAVQPDNPLKVMASFNKLRSFVGDVQKDFYEACQEADAIVYHPGAAIGYFAARQLDIPSILATPFPMTPTRDYPALIFYDGPRAGGSFNWVTHKLFEQIMWFASSAVVKSFWKQEFGKAPKDYGSPFARQNTRTNPTIISCSPAVFPRGSDWPEHVHSDGYWFLDEEPGWTPPAELQKFLSRGKPPVYVGFGSAGQPFLARQTTELVIAALKRAGQRGVLATGWNGMAKTGTTSEDIFILESAPHSWLFPRMAAVIHHGGAGTTAAGLRAGVPAVIVPHSNDQFAWARRVHELGAGVKPVPRKKLTVENLSAAIQAALAPEIIGYAKELGLKIQNEHGAETAAKIIINCR